MKPDQMLAMIESLLDQDLAELKQAMAGASPNEIREMITWVGEHYAAKNNMRERVVGRAAVIGLGVLLASVLRDQVEAEAGA